MHQNYASFTKTQVPDVSQRRAQSNPNFHLKWSLSKKWKKIFRAQQITSAVTSKTICLILSRSAFTFRFTHCFHLSIMALSMENKPQFKIYVLICHEWPLSITIPHMKSSITYDVQKFAKRSNFRRKKVWTIFK